MHHIIIHTRMAYTRYTYVQVKNVELWNEVVCRETYIVHKVPGASLSTHELSAPSRVVNFGPRVCSGAVRRLSAGGRSCIQYTFKMARLGTWLNFEVYRETLPEKHMACPLLPEDMQDLLSVLALWNACFTAATGRASVPEDGHGCVGHTCLRTL